LVQLTTAGAEDCRECDDLQSRPYFFVLAITEPLQGIGAGNISLSLSFDDGAHREPVFNALAVGGRIAMPMDKAFWGGRFEMVTDRFGTEWMVSLP